VRACFKNFLSILDITMCDWKIVHEQHSSSCLGGRLAQEKGLLNLHG